MIYGGVKYYKVRHALYCKKCFVTIESTGSLVYCSCGAIGIDEDRILGDLEDMEDRSMYVATVRGKRVWLPESILYAQFKSVKNLHATSYRSPSLGSDYTLNGYRSPSLGSDYTLSACRSPSLGSDYTLNGYRSPTTHPPDKEETQTTFHSNPAPSKAPYEPDDQSAHNSEHIQYTSDDSHIPRQRQGL